jgi:hypothetical protein
VRNSVAEKPSFLMPVERFRPVRTVRLWTAC